MKIFAGRNIIEWACIFGTFFILGYFIFPLYYSAMAKDLHYKYFELVVAARYLGILALIGLGGITIGFEYMEEMRSNAIAGRKGFNYSAETYFYGSLLILILGSTIFLDGLVMWYYDIREVNWQLGVLIIKSGIWQISSMIVVLGGAYLRDCERRRRVGRHAVKKK
jgi:hypothetical protein